MTIALTGATGFLGRYVARRLAADGHSLRCWYRPSSDRGGFDELPIDWVPGDLGEPDAGDDLVAGCDAVVHAALWHPGGGFRGGEGDVVAFAERNVLGSLRLIEAARDAGVDRFVLVSTCAVHEKILDDRPLDEDHPTRPKSHYGAHKAALEQFVQSYGLGDGYDICALRPTGIYGLARPAGDSKWYELVEQVVRGEAVEARGGGKEVHAADVAGAVGTLLTADGEQIRGRAFNCYDRYVSKHEVATLAAELAGTSPNVDGTPSAPKHQIETGRLRSLGVTFGGETRLRETVAELVAAAT